MAEIDFAAKLKLLTVPQREIAQTALDWGYGSTYINRRSFLWKGRTVLDIGMGGGPHCIPYLVGGAAGYVGVDPLVKTEKVHDRRSRLDPSIPTYHAFPYATDQMMEAFPNLHLYSARMEEATDQIRQHRPNLITLSSVTEHLHQPELVMRKAWEVTTPDAILWLSHANYYSWTGHHRPPRSVEDWKRNGRDPENVTDWQHLDPKHPCYSRAHLNRIRLKDFRDVVEKYFKVYEWLVSIDALERLTPEIRRRWSKYTTEEFLARTIFVCGVRRDRPLDISLAGRQLHHPAEDYMSDQDHSAESMEPFRKSNLVSFRDAYSVVSHAYNDHQGGRIMAALAPGDRIKLQKFPRIVECTVKRVIKTKDDLAWIQVEAELPSDIVAEDESNWVIVDVLGVRSDSGAQPGARYLAEELAGNFQRYCPRAAEAEAGTVAPS